MPVLPVHPLLFSVFPIIALYAKNTTEFPIRQVYWPLCLALAGTAGVWALFMLLTRHARKAALAASPVVLVFFSYGHLFNLAPAPVRGLVGPACAVGLVILLIAILRTRQPLVDATKVLNLASILLLVSPTWAIGTSLYRAAQAGGERSARVLPASSAVTQKPTAVRSDRRVAAVRAPNLPDVYYIILDAYGGSDSLKLFYGYDNGPFLRALEKRGFYVARRSRANYVQTPLCLASSLNMTYLDRVADRVGEECPDVEACRQMLDDNAVAAFLSKLGHHYVTIWSRVAQTRVDTADLVLNGESPASTFQGQIESLSAFNAAPQAEHARYDEHREHILGGFRSLNTAARLPYPKFVFAHIMAPHPPFVFGSKGEPVDPRGPITLADASWLLKNISGEEYRAGYVAQLQFVNRKVLEAVDSILRASQRPPIIIIQGDHGSRMNLDWDSLDKTNVREPLSILNAYYVPDRVRRRLYDTITPVNSFRILLAAEFGATFARLPDRSYYSTISRPYEFTNVTRLMNRPRAAKSPEPKPARPSTSSSPADPAAARN